MTDRISRRQFATLAGSSALLAGAASSAEATQKAAEVAAKIEESKSTLELTVQIAKQEFPNEKLDATAIEEIRSDIRSNLSRSKALSAFPLTNADEPGFIFAAWRKDLA